MKLRLNAVCIIEKENKILLGQKALGVGPYAGSWLIPGGGVHSEDESIDEAMARELKEETNLVPKTYERLHFSEDVAELHGETKRLVFLFYHITDVVNWDEVKAGDDLVTLKWFSKSELSKIPLPPPSIILFKKLGWI